MTHTTPFTLTHTGNFLWRGLVGAVAVVMVVVGAAPVWAQDADATANANAQAMQPFNVRVIDVDGVRTQSSAFQEARKQISAFGKNMNEALKKEDVALREANTELSRKRTLLAPEAFADERKKFEQRVAAFQRKTQEQQKSINKVQLDAVGQINNKILQIITEYARTNNVSMILPAQSVLLRAETMNMDAHVLQRLNKELPSVKLALPAQ